MKAKRILRLLCACLVIVLSLSLFAGCKSRELSPERLAKKEVGTVGGYTVYYDELYTLAFLSYEDGMTEDELWNAVSGKILDNYAKLILCDEYGVEYDEKELEDDVQTSIDSMIDETFGGDRDKYLDALEGMSTDRYTRFNTKVELLYSKLPTALAMGGEMSADEDQVVEYIVNNFVRVKHFMVANGEGDDKDKSLADAEAALAALRSGKTTMNELIGGKYKVDGHTLINDDLLIPYDGYTIGKGTMEQAYEDAAFSLDVGEFSDVVTAEGELGTGETAECYYVIERLELTENYVKSNYSELYETYSNVIVSEKLTEKIATLEFKPNDYAKSLNILELEEIGVGIDVTLIVIICVSAVVAVGIAVGVFFIIRHFRKKKTGKNNGKALPKGKKK